VVTKFAKAKSFQGTIRLEQPESNTPVETSTSVSNSHGLVISVVIEAGSQPI